MKLDDATLDRRLAALTRHAEADETTWTAIEARLKPRRRLWPAGVASGISVAAALALAVLVTQPPEQSSPAAIMIAAEVEAMRSQAKDYFLPVSSTINGNLAAAWDDNQAAIDELEAALDRHPENTMLIEFLAQARLRQSELIHQAAAGGAVADSRNI